MSPAQVLDPHPQTTEEQKEEPDVADEDANFSSRTRMLLSKIQTPDHTPQEGLDPEFEALLEQMKLKRNTSNHQHTLQEENNPVGMELPHEEEVTAADIGNDQHTLHEENNPVGMELPHEEEVTVADIGNDQHTLQEENNPVGMELPHEEEVTAADIGNQQDSRTPGGTTDFLVYQTNQFPPVRSVDNFVKCFPFLFPYGRGSFSEFRPVRIGKREWLMRCLRIHGGMFIYLLIIFILFCMIYIC